MKIEIRTTVNGREMEAVGEAEPDRAGMVAR